MRDRIIECLARAIAEGAPDSPGGARARRFSHRGGVSLVRRDAFEPDALPAAVLVPLVERPEGMTVLFTRRTDHLADHPGQISFPGGRMEPGDRDAVETALRETEEEIGLTRRRIEPLGRLDVYTTSTGYHVTPVVGLIRPPFELRIDHREVAATFEVPLDFLIDPASRREEKLIRDGVELVRYAFVYEERTIWGVTAGIIVNLCDRLRPA